ncbi:MAG: mltC [Firmicutes bacterium]|nr:mltC [Bacillota bacterium]
MVNGISNIFQRIDTIERRFGIKAENPINFSAELTKAQEYSARTQQSAETTKIINSIEKAAVQYGVDPRLAVAVAKTESGLSANAVSSAGAIGIMQLMPETASAMGVNDINDAQQNINGGVRYLRQMLDIFGGDIDKAIAAYNAGPNAVAQYGSVPPFKETQNYVAQVKALY